jgi:hypothetical protein
MNPHELVNDIKEIKNILVDLERRKEPATAEQLKAINDRQIIINPEKFAAYVSEALVNALKEKLPNTENIKDAANMAIIAIQDSSTRTAGHINGAGIEAAQRIEKAARRQADVLASRIGFTSWQSALFIFLMFLLLSVGAIFSNQDQAQKLAQSQAQIQGVREFTNWVREQPEGRRLYDRYYNRQ